MGIRNACLVAIAGLTLACRASAPENPSRPGETGGRDLYLILAAELESTNRDNLYDAVHQLRPGWFSRPTRRGSGEQTIIVYLDDRQMGSADILRNISVRVIKSARYLGPTEAQVRYGQRNAGRPAIVLEARRD
jgi:hypothetical protein